MDITWSIVLTLGLLFSIILGLMLIAFEDGVPFGLIRKFNCKRGRHKHIIKIGKYKRSLYYCAFCKARRKHPKLELIEGGNKFGDSNFYF